MFWLLSLLCSAQWQPLQSLYTAQHFEEARREVQVDINNGCGIVRLAATDLDFFSPSGWIKTVTSSCVGILKNFGTFWQPPMQNNVSTMFVILTELVGIPNPEAIEVISFCCFFAVNVSFFSEWSWKVASTFTWATTCLGAPELPMKIKSVLWSMIKSAHD